MKEQNILQCKNRNEFRQWLMEHCETESECWVQVKHGRPNEDNVLWYLDAVEEVLCFGWIDSQHKLIKGQRMQRFSPRRKNSPWTELNKERVRRLERLGLMTDSGRKTLPPMGKNSFKFDEDVVSAMKKARIWTKFRSFPPLYQRIRVYNTTFYKKRNPEKYQQTLTRLIEETKKGKMFGQWNDYGRLV